MNIQTKLIHTAGSPDNDTKGTIPPIHCSTIFAMDSPTSTEGFQYGRVANPTRQILESTLAELEHAKHALVFSSGSAAITMLLFTLKKGECIVCHELLYEGTIRILKQLSEHSGFRVIFTNLADDEKLKHVLKEQPAMVFTESVTNPLLTVLPIKKIGAMCHEHETIFAVDNTCIGPTFQTPLSDGADIVIESLSKIISGHSDVIGGCIATNNTTLWETLKWMQHTFGAVLSPFDSFLTLRGMKTLTLRAKQQNENAKSVVAFLKHHEGITRVHYPGFGFLLSFELDSTRMKPIEFLKRLDIITIGHSFGGTETVIQQPTTMMDLSFTPEKQNKFRMRDEFFRLSVGLENIDDIIKDLKNALTKEA